MVTTLWSGWPLSTTDFSISVAVGHACTQAPHETHSEDRKSTLPGEIWESKPRPSKRERERTLRLFAGAHAARTNDAFAGIEGEVRIGFVLLGVEVIFPS